MLRTRMNVSGVGSNMPLSRKRFGQRSLEQIRIGLARVMGAGLLIMCLQSRRSATPFVMAALALEGKPDTEALDRRIAIVLQLFEKADSIEAKLELRNMAELYPSYAPASFLLGLVLQGRDEPETAVGFYAAALRAGGPLFFCCGT